LTALLTPPARPQQQADHGITAAGGSVAGLVNFVLRQREGGRHDAVLWALCRAYEDKAPLAVIEAICQAAEMVGKPRSEVDAMRAWAAGQEAS
jgi:hypothetical protein